MIYNNLKFIITSTLILLQIAVSSQSNYGVINYTEIDSLVNQSILENEHYSRFLDSQDSIVQVNQKFIQQTFLDIQKRFNGGCLSPIQAENYKNYINHLSSEFSNFIDSQKEADKHVKSILVNIINDYVQKEIYQIKFRNSIDFIFDSKMIKYSDDKVQDLTYEVSKLISRNNENLISTIREGDPQLKIALNTYLNPKDLRIKFNTFMINQKKE